MEHIDNQDKILDEEILSVSKNAETLVESKKQDTARKIRKLKNKKKKKNEILKRLKKKLKATIEKKKEISKKSEEISQKIRKDKSVLNEASQEQKTFTTKLLKAKCTKLVKSGEEFDLPFSNTMLSGGV